LKRRDDVRARRLDIARWTRSDSVEIVGDRIIALILPWARRVERAV